MAEYAGKHARPAMRRERRSAEDRRRQVVQVASRLLAEQGFEGFRTRDVAAAAKINIATLHYHFPTKQSLVKAIVADIVGQFRSARREAPGTSALDELRLEFQDVRTRLVSAREQLAVLTELAIRARRDPEIATLLLRMDRGWRGQLASILQRGQDSGEFQSNFRPSDAANAIMTQLRSLGYVVGVSPAALLNIFDQIQAQIELWLIKGAA